MENQNISKLDATFFALAWSVALLLIYTLIFSFVYFYPEKSLELILPEALFKFVKKMISIRNISLEAHHLGLSLTAYAHGALKIFISTFIPTWLAAGIYNFFIDLRYKNLG